MIVPAGRVALVGAGAFGRFCLDVYSAAPDLSVVAVADPSAAALARVGAIGGRLETEWRSLLHDDSIEVIHVATPPYLREDVIAAALEAGKSVFCEKPLALSLPDADAMITQAAARDLTLSVNYVMRHQPAYMLLERLANSGLVGSLRTISFQNFAQLVPPDHWFWDRAKSGGIFVEHGVHFFDAYARIAGPPLEIHGTAPRREAVDATIHYAGGALGRFYHEFAFPHAIEQTLGISLFERGSVEIAGWIPERMSGSVLASREAVQEVVQSIGIDVHITEDTATRFAASFPNRQASYRAAILAGMRDVLRRHRDPTYQMKVSPEDARASLALALAAQEAAPPPPNPSSRGGGGVLERHCVP
ncbi:MAG: Gfo/Idh/MocA family oxidoreductase [Chloroflexota bacterium]|nr:Gfo/Idh/MocA family oxidoreductase [Chloroflexota bacterium]